MTTKAESNRVNSRRSTGPKTPAGKAKVSKNAERHGAYSESLSMLLEKPEEFEKLRRGLVEDLRPTGPMEENLVERLVSLWWRMDRAKVVANQALWMGARHRLRPTFMRFRASVEEERMDPFEEGEFLDADECRLNGAWDQDRQERLLRHELTLERSFFRTLHELERIQARRDGLAVPPPLTLDVNITGTQD